MKNLLLAILFLSAYSVSAQDIWIDMDSIKGKPRSAASSFVLYGEGYAIGGLDEDGPRRKVHAYNYAQDDWDSKPSIGGINGAGQNRASASAFSIGNIGYVCLGAGPTDPFKKDLWSYDPITGAWEQLANFIGEPRTKAVSFGFDTIAFVGTGYSAIGFLKDFYKYSQSTNTWTQVSDFGGTPRMEAVGFRMAGYGYVGTGDDGVFKNDFWQYDPLTDQWTQKANFPGTSRRGAVGWGTFPQAFIATGEDITQAYTNDVWEYNYYSDTWTQRTSIPGPGRCQAISFVINGIAFVAAGYNGTQTESLMDDMYAYSKLAALDENEKPVYTLGPNPSTETIFIRTNDQIDFKAVTLDGKDVTNNLIIEESINGLSINKGSIPSGNYLFYLTNKLTGQVALEKIVFI